MLLRHKLLLKIAGTTVSVPSVLAGAYMAVSGLTSDDAQTAYTDILNSTSNTDIGHTDTQQMAATGLPDGVTIQDAPASTEVQAPTDTAQTTDRVTTPRVEIAALSRFETGSLQSPDGTAAFTQPMTAATSTPASRNDIQESITSVERLTAAFRDYPGLVPDANNTSQLMAYAPASRADNDRLSDIFDTIIAAPAIPDIQTRNPTRIAHRTDEVCHGERWSIIDSNGAVIDDSQNRALIACPMASLTKIMTLYLAFQAFEEDNGFNADSNVTITSSIMRHSQEGHAHRSGYAGRGTRNSAGYMAILTGRLSDARATNALAVEVGRAYGLRGSDDAVMQGFINLMNKTAQELGLSNTEFSNAVGFTNNLRLRAFSEASNVSTAEDMARLLMETYEAYPEWTRRALGERQAGDGYNIQGHTLAQLVTDNGIDMAKSGTARASARRAIAFSMEVDGERLFVSILGASTSSRRTALTQWIASQTNSMLQTARLEQ